MVLGVAGWDRKEFPESNLHVCGRDNTKIVVYNMGRCTKKGKEGRINELEIKNLRTWQTNIFKGCYLRIKYLSTNFLVTLM